MTHKTTVAPSALSAKDLDKFKDLNGQEGYRKGPNEVLFGDNYRALMNVKAFEQLRDKILTALCSVTTVVPKNLVDHHLAEVCKSEFLRGMVDSIVPSTPSASFSGETVQLMLKNAISHVCLELSNDLRGKQLQVTKEVQKNDWYIDMLKDELERQGFTVKHRFMHTQFSIYGKSRPDFYFYREHKKGMKNTTVHAGMVLADSDEEELDLIEVHLEGSSTEFKMGKGDTSKFLPQTSANMVRVASLLVVESLEIGCLVGSITINGMLADYKSEICTPMQYQVDFNTNESVILIGTDLPLVLTVDCFAIVVSCM